MPKFQAIHARIKVSDEELLEYDVQVDENERQVSCWVPSEAGKNFAICWTNTDPLTDTSGQIMLDGIQAGGYFCKNGSTRECVCSDCYVSSTTIRKFCFSPITFTDDDDYIGTSSANLGEIKLEVWTVVNPSSSPYKQRVEDPVASFDAVVHERSKKVGAHRVRFGDLEEAPGTTFFTYTKVYRMATFIFRYRPLDILQANDIAPLAPRAAHAEQSNKRKLSEDDVIEIYSSDEDEIDQHVKELKDKLKRLESRRVKKAKVKVEKAEHSIRSNGVVDLT